MNELHERLQSFARSLLERRGALVEWPEGEAAAGLAMLPRELAERLSCTETVELTLEAAVAGKRDVLIANLVTDFLERVEGLVEEEPREACLRLGDLYLKKSPMDEPVARMFAWPNARVRVRGAMALRTEYLFWYFQATLESQERWKDLIRVTLNGVTGAQIALPDVLRMNDAQEMPGGDRAPVDVAWAKRRAADLAQAKAAEFVRQLESRLERDRRRIKEYYGALLAEDGHGKPGQAGDEPKRREKRRAVELELRRKLLELDERYAIRTTLEPIALVRLEMPALLVECEVLRRQARGTVTVVWNPLLKELEPLACRRCGRNIVAVHFDEALTPLCGDCLR